MATTEIKQFAGSGGANVLTQAEYEALTSTLANGFPAGILPSTYLNKVLRQAMFISAGVAGYCVAQGISVPDDGDLAALVTKITDAIAAQVGGAGLVPTSRTITASSPLTGGGDLSANRSIGIQDATTGQKGAVQLSSSTSSTSETLAATPKAVKDAYDLADAALPLAGGATMTGTFVAALGQEVEFANRLKPVATLTYAVGEFAIAEDLRGAGNYGWGHNDTLPAAGVGAWGVRDATDTLVYPTGTWKSFGQWRDTDGAFDPKHYSFIVRVS